MIKTRIQTATNTSELSSSISTKQTITNPIIRLLNRNATLKALVSIYKHEGILGAFSGVGPRFIWTGIQSSIMLLLYQVALKQLDVLSDDKDRDKLES